MSPYLFIIAVDILARIMIQENNIKGFQINSQNIKMTQYADDLTLMLSDMNSINEALSLLKTFGEYSGLRVNTMRTQIIAPLRLSNLLKNSHAYVAYSGTYDY